MKIHLVLLILSLLGSIRPLPAGSGPSVQVSEVTQAVSIQGIKKEKAIDIAKKHARKTYKSVERFKVVACEQTIFWRIIFDGGGPEYVIDKQSGAIRRVQKIPQDWPTRSENDPVAAKTGITRDKAIEIAKRDAESVPGIDIERFTIFACELDRVWRVFVEFKLHLEPGDKSPVIPHSSAPNYVIDKWTGKILFKQRYGSAKH